MGIAPNQLEITAHNAVNKFLNIAAGEQVIILIDSGTSPSIPKVLSEQIVAAGAEPIVVSVVPRATSGTNLPRSVLQAVANADVVISACSRSPYHSNLKTIAQEAGVRGTLNSPPHEDGWIAGAMTIDFHQLRPVANKLRQILDQGSLARVVNPAGTDVTMSIAGRNAVGWLCGIASEPGHTVAWPGGEVSLPPIEGTAEGVVVVTVAMTDIGGVSEPMTWEVSKGLASKISGGQEASRLKELIKNVDFATNIGELGIGINSSARLVDDITEAKKRRGTAHIALGDSANGYGGAVDCALHLDGLIPDVTVYIDGQAVVNEGQLLLD